LSDPADPRQSAPSALRNRDPILAQLRGLLPERGRVLEIASGTGEHVAHFAAHLPGLVFQPTNRDAAGRASIDAWASGLGNVRPAVPLDTTGDWPGEVFDAVLCINMIHIAPWEATLGLLRGAASVLLLGGGVLLLYGPFRQGGRHTAPSNAAFDADLRTRDPSWGVRDLEALAAEAARHGFGLLNTIAMPTNNLLVSLRKH
jgi:hypothetical protein